MQSRLSQPPGSIAPIFDLLGLAPVVSYKSVSLSSGILTVQRAVEHSDALKTC